MNFFLAVFTSGYDLRCQSYRVHNLFVHCNASDTVLEILKHDYIWRDNLH